VRQKAGKPAALSFKGFFSFFVSVFFYRTTVKAREQERV
jgi:hypothetical protein